MPPSRLSAADNHVAASPEGGDEDGGGGGDHPPPFLDLPRLLATARHGDVSTLPPDQRHLLARMLWAGGVVPSLIMQGQEVLRRRQRLILHQRRLQQHQQRQKIASCSKGSGEEFKHPQTLSSSPKSQQQRPRNRDPCSDVLLRDGTVPSSFVRRPAPTVQHRQTDDSSNNNALRDHKQTERNEKEDINFGKRASSPSEPAPENLTAPSLQPLPPPPPPPLARHVGKCMPPLKRLRVSSISSDDGHWVPVTPRTTHPKRSQGPSFSSLSPSTLSSSTPSSESQWRPVKVADLSPFKSSSEGFLKQSPTSLSTPNWLSSRSHSPTDIPNDATDPKILASNATDCKVFPKKSAVLVVAPNNVQNGRRRSCTPPLSVTVHRKKQRLLNRKDKVDYEVDNGSNYVTPIRVPDGSCFAPTPCPRGAPPSLKYHWMNQLTRIFLQEVPEDAQDKEAETAEGGSAAAPGGATTTTTSTSTASSSSLPSAGKTCGNTETSANLSNNNKSSSPSLSCSQGAPVATTLAGSGMGNPFARPPPSATWGQASESNDPKPILAPSRLGPSSDAGATKVSSSGGSSVLRQPTLTAGRPSASMKSPSSLFTPPAPTVTVSSPPQPSRSAFKLKPSVLGSAKPFGKITSNSESRVDSASGSEDGASKASGETSPHSLNVSSSTSVTTANTSAASSGDRDHSSSDSRTSSSSSNSISNSSSPRNMFVPLSRNGDGTDSSLSPTIRNNSIFGQNLISKVTGAESSVTSSSDSSSATTNGERQTGNLFTEAASGISRISDSGAATNGRIGGTGNLFSEAASEILLPTEENAWNSGPSLAETSRELTEKENSQKRKFDQVEVITGEESESNVLQMNCKLYAWVCGSWQERGRGILRLNDWDAGQEIHSRLVIRTQGTLTVMLNTKVWAEMSVERASNKSVRFTALDADGQPKIFLAMGSPKDVDLLYNSLEWRVAASRSQTHEEGDSDNTKKAKKEEAGATALTR